MSTAKKENKEGGAAFIQDVRPQYPCELYSPKGNFWSVFHSFNALSGELDHGWTMWRPLDAETIASERDGYRIRNATLQADNEKLRGALAKFLRAGNLHPQMGGGYVVSGWNPTRLNGAAEEAMPLLTPRPEGVDSKEGKK